MYTKKLLTIATLGFSALALAEDVNMPATPSTSATSTASEPQQAAPIKIPPRGSTMSSVEASFGAPTQRGEAVGKPPITKWEYPNFIVYFEYEHVVHTVVR